MRAIVAAAAFIATTALAIPATAQTTERVQVTNRSGQTLLVLQASPTNNPRWEDDLMGRNTLGNGQVFDLTIHNVVNCNYDVRLQFADGDIRIHRVNVCRTNEFTINP